MLWTLYTSIRIDPKTRITERTTSKKLNKNAFVIISAEAGLSGDIDERLIETMLQDFDSKTTDIIVLGNHGATQLRQNRIPFVRYFSVPSSESYIDVSPVIEAISHYNHTTVYYEEYISLGVQGIKKLDLISSIRAMTKDLIPGVEVMTTQDTIFEPSLDEIADLIESVMMTLAFSQAILESSLAQDASRFNAMASAKKRAWDLYNYFKLDYYRAKRSEADRRSREIMVTLKRKRRKAAGL